MSLPQGAKLGPYEIVEPVGTGGMGEVYKARDTRLGRSVALKILPPTPKSVEATPQRFETEARAISQLSHVNVCALYDIGEQDGIPFLVMELLDGETLAERLKRGALPIPEALQHGAEICAALAHAHGAGIVHRDLKPANIMLTKQGVKVLDFGLAHATTPAEAVPDQGAKSISKQLTIDGQILGTPQYMAPEQIEGKAVDARVDIFAFGLLLYEMVTGRPAFVAESLPAMITTILRDTPTKASEIRSDLPRSVERLIEACLKKKPDERLRSAHDVILQLRWISEDLASPSSRAFAMATRPANVMALRWVAVGAAVLAVAATLLWLGARLREDEPAWSQFTQLTDDAGLESGPALSPDGGLFAYASATNGSWDVYTQRVGGRTPVLVAGDPSVDELWPAFSPDGTQLALSRGGSGGISVVGATGESLKRITDFGSNPSWSPDGRQIVFCTEQLKTGYERSGMSELWVVDLNDGRPRKLDSGDAIQPAWSPSGTRIAFWQNIGGQRDLVTIPAEGGARVLATNDAAVDWAPTWSPDGRYLYFASDRGGSMGIWRLAIDENTGRAQGDPQAIAMGADLSFDLPRLSADGRSLLFRSMIQSVNPAAIAFDPATRRAGAVRLLHNRTGKLIPTDVSPDGRWLALNNRPDRRQDVFVMRSDGTELTRLTDDLARDSLPRFTPDGAALVFQSNKDGAWDAWSIRLDGSNRTRLTEMGDAYGPAFSPDGRLMVTAGPSGDDILIGAPPLPLTRKSATLIKPPQVGGGTFSAVFWSRDGRWLQGGISPSNGGVRGNALFDLAKGVVRQLSDDAVGYEMAWMPGYASVLYFTASGKLVIQDIDSLKREEIGVTLPYPPDTYRSLAASPDGRTLYYGAQQVEGNIWKVEQPKPR